MKLINILIILLFICPLVFADWELLTSKTYNYASLASCRTDFNNTLNYATFLNPPYVSQTIDETGNILRNINLSGNARSYPYGDYLYVVTNDDFKNIEFKQFNKNGTLIWDYKKPVSGTYTYHLCVNADIYVNNKYLVSIVNGYNYQTDKHEQYLLLKEHTSNKMTFNLIHNENENIYCRNFYLSTNGLLSILHEKQTSPSLDNIYDTQYTNSYQTMLELININLNKTIYFDQHFDSVSFTFCASDDGSYVVAGNSKLNVIMPINGKIYTREIIHPYIFQKFFLTTCTIYNNKLFVGWMAYETQQNMVSIFELPKNPQFAPFYFDIKWKYEYNKHPTSQLKDSILQIAVTTVKNIDTFSVVSAGLSGKNQRNVTIPQLYVFNEVSEKPLFTNTFVGTQYLTTIVNKNNQIIVSSCGGLDHATIPSDGGEINIFGYKY